MFSLSTGMESHPELYDKTLPPDRLKRERDLREVLDALGIEQYENVKVEGKFNIVWQI